MWVDVLGGPKDGFRVNIPPDQKELVLIDSGGVSTADLLFGRAVPSIRYVLPIRDGKALWYEKKEWGQ